MMTLPLKKQSFYPAFFFAVLLSHLFHAPVIFSEDHLPGTPEITAELEQELKWLKAETYVITASKVMEEIKKAPASITVVTDRQIRQMGAKNLPDVIKRAVPSFSSFQLNMGQPVPLVRGGSEVLLMINNHPIYNVWSQTAYGLRAYDTLNVDNIKRIEFIRGPGSAIYGANAYAGVINVITKKSEDIDGLELTARGGSFDTQQYNLLFGKTLNDLEVVFNFNYFKTHGHRAFIREDFQTQIDRAFQSYGIPSNASLAPGRTKGDDEKYEVALNLKYKGFTFDGRYVDREVDLPFPYSQALTEKVLNTPEDYYLNLSYETAIKEGLNLLVKGYRQLLDFTEDYQLFPPGFIAPVLNPTPPPATILAIWPEGLLAEFTMKDSRTGIEIQTTYKIGDSNTLVAGATYEEQKIDDINSWSNFLTTDYPGVFIQFPSMQELGDYFSQAQKRNFKAFFLEDIWDMTDNIRLTAGLRYDHYSDFGGHFSPRIGLTWEYISGYDVKLLYGHAFLAPTPGHIRFSAPGTTLDPQTVDTYEVSLGADFTSSMSGRITFFQNNHKDLMRATLLEAPWYYVNLGTARTRGVEVEAKYDFRRGSYLAGNYAYFDHRNLPHPYGYLGKLMSNIRLSRHLNFYADCMHFGGGERRRMPGDLREDTSSITIVNATLIARKFLKGYEGLELRGSVYNLFDEDGLQWIGESVPYGWPKPGRNFLIEMKYTFE